VTAQQRRIVVAVCVIYFLSFLMVGGLTFLVTPMADDLKLEDGTVQYMLAIPSVVGLVAVFSAGQVGSRFGDRYTIAAAGLIFSLGAAVIALAPGGLLVQVGLSICALTVMAMQIVTVSLLREVTGTGDAQVSAFTTLGMVGPLAFLVIPLATARVLTAVNWRLVPLAWVVGGIVVALVALRAIKRDSASRPSGELLTPLLAGISLAAAARAIAELGNAQMSPDVIPRSLLVCVLAAGACAIIVRRSRNPSFSTSAIRGVMMRPMMIGVALVSFVQLLTFVSIALEFVYGLTAVEAAVATVPAQVAGILGAKLLAKKAIDRWGSFRASLLLLLAVAATMLPMLAFTKGSSLWLLVAIASAFTFTTMAALTAFTTDVMRRSPDDDTETVSSFRAASGSMGAAIGASVFGIVILSRTPIAAGTKNITAAEITDMINGLRLAGLIAALVAIAGALMLTVMERRSPPRDRSVAQAA
jgi:MFS family permease